MNEDGCQWNQGSSTQKFLSKSKVVREHVNVSCLLMCVLHISFYVSVVYRIHAPKKKNLSTLRTDRDGDDGI